ncbi:hypothetical protein MRB53_015095 [Persea americana]|uniref:Uncharacterized protein n=1 Tax=Persea americana TaxID=3435 RepID=A0ACC2KCN4_PERAE|nr:hypothetical protein MRB53_015095 [Persea americana]
MIGLFRNHIQDCLEELLLLSGFFWFSIEDGKSDQDPTQASFSSVQVGPIPVSIFQPPFREEGTERKEIAQTIGEE